MPEGPRVAMLSVHTSPLDQPGTGDAGGMNVYVTELAAALAARGATVDVFTRAADPGQPEIVPLAPGVTVRHVAAGPAGAVPKGALPELLPAFAAGLARAGRRHTYDVVHSHYWLSGLVAREAACRWDAPLVHTMHTLAKVKNAVLAPGDVPEPAVRVCGEEQVVAGAHALVVSARHEAAELIAHYGADPAAVHVVEPGVDTDLFHPGSSVVDAAGLGAARARARRELGLPEREPVLLFAGRVQPLKGTDVLVRALAELAARGGAVPRLVVLGGPSGAAGRVHELGALADRLGVAAHVDMRPPVGRADLGRWYRAADVVAVPSRSESFGLVASEAQACGAAVVAAAVGGLRTVVRHGVSGLLVPDHDPARWARVLADLLADPARCAALGVGGHAAAARRGWDGAAAAVLDVYRQACARRRAFVAA